MKQSEFDDLLRRKFAEFERLKERELSDEFVFPRFEKHPAGY
jgi:hypothetical protein